ncbi:hypothetical protein H0A65_14890 [Alcaligenaceae bacterium]|nr:hypothetical protein [Alcaligenaceae bacterium]
MTYLSFDKTLKPARARFPEGACDCHFHIFDHASTYPLASTAAYTPTPATEQDYRALCKAYGIDRAVLVHPSVYGADHASYEAIMAANPDDAGRAYARHLRARVFTGLRTISASLIQFRMHNSQPIGEDL